MGKKFDKLDDASKNDIEAFLKQPKIAEGISDFAHMQARKSTIEQGFKPDDQNNIDQYNQILFSKADMIEEAYRERLAVPAAVRERVKNRIAQDLPTEIDAESKAITQLELDIQRDKTFPLDTPFHAESSQDKGNAKTTYKGDSSATEEMFNLKTDIPAVAANTAPAKPAAITSKPKSELPDEVFSNPSAEEAQRALAQAKEINRLATESTKDFLFPGGASNAFADDTKGDGVSSLKASIAANTAQPAAKPAPKKQEAPFTQPSFGESFAVSAPQGRSFTRKAEDTAEALSSAVQAVGNSDTVKSLKGLALKAQTRISDMAETLKDKQAYIASLPATVDNLSAEIRDQLAADLQSNKQLSQAAKDKLSSGWMAEAANNGSSAQAQNQAFNAAITGALTEIAARDSQSAQDMISLAEAKTRPTTVVVDGASYTRVPDKKATPTTPSVAASETKAPIVTASVVEAIEATTPAVVNAAKVAATVATVQQTAKQALQSVSGIAIKAADFIKTQNNNAAFAQVNDGQAVEFSVDRNATNAKNLAALSTAITGLENAQKEANKVREAKTSAGILSSSQLQAEGDQITRSSQAYGLSAEQANGGAFVDFNASERGAEGVGAHRIRTSTLNGAQILAATSDVIVDTKALEAGKHSLTFVHEGQAGAYWGSQGKLRLEIPATANSTITSKDGKTILEISEGAKKTTLEITGREQDLTVAKVNADGSIQPAQTLAALAHEKREANIYAGKVLQADIASLTAKDTLKEAALKGLDTNGDNKVTDQELKTFQEQHKLDFANLAKALNVKGGDTAALLNGVAQELKIAGVAVSTAGSALATTAGTGPTSSEKAR